MKWLINFSWAIIWSAIMLLLMLRPSSGNSPSFFEGFDKLAHCGSFFLLTALLLFGTIIHSKRTISKIKSATVVLIVTSIFAVMTELAQHYFTTTRQAEWWDIFADFVGIGMAIFAYILFYRKRI